MVTIVHELKSLLDEKNMPVLREHALLPQYLSLYYNRYLLAAAVEPGYPAETTDRSLALHLSYLYTTAGEAFVEVL